MPNPTNIITAEKPIMVHHRMNVLTLFTTEAYFRLYAPTKAANITHLLLGSLRFKMYLFQYQYSCIHIKSFASDRNKHKCQERSVIRLVGQKKQINLNPFPQKLLCDQNHSNWNIISNFKDLNQIKHDCRSVTITTTILSQILITSLIKVMLL